LIRQKLIIFLCFVCFLKANAQEDYPVLSQIVTDGAGLFSESETLQLRQKLTDYEIKTTHQIVILTINNLGNDTVENYAYRVFNNNKLGQAAADNGLLILIAKNDRKFRIEVGDGLTPIITDAFSSRIIRNIMTPEFKDGNFYNGVDFGTSEIIKLIDSPEYRDEFTNSIENEDTIPFWGKVLFSLFITAFLGVFIFVGGRVFLGGYKQLINLYIGLITGKVSILIFPVLLFATSLGIIFSLPFIVMPILFWFIFSSNYEIRNYLIFIAVILLVIIPLIIAFFTRSKKKYTPIKFSLTKSSKSFMSKNFSSGGISSGSSSFSSSSSSSSFSGGGGSSSGGGASGSW